MDVHSPAFIENPYPFYEARRLQAPLIKRDSFAWAVTGYDVMSRILAHPAAGRGNVGQTPRLLGDRKELQKLKPDNLALDMLERWMLFQNPPEHTQSRRRVADVFTLKVVDQLEALMRDTMRELIANVKSKYPGGKFDLVREIAYPYPIKVICDMLGIPEEDQNRFASWTQDFSLAVQTDFHTVPDDRRKRLNQTALEISKYFDQLIPSKKAENSDDLISRFIEAGSENLGYEDLLSNCVFLLFAGQDTTTSLIANTVNAFLNNPEQLRLLRASPSLSKNAVEECLRFDPSIQMVGRFALDDIVLQDTVIKKGEHMFNFLGASGRDPAANADPHKFDITRDKIKHLAFARGAHHCLGASLARLELRVMLEELISGFPDLALASPGVRRKTWLMRGFQSLPVSYSGK